MPSRAISAFTTEVPNSTSDLLYNVGSTTRRGNAAQVVTAGLGAPTSGAVLTYSSGSSAPSWSIPTSGAVMVASSVGVPVWRAIGTSGQVLESTGGTPTWVTQVVGGTTNAWDITNGTSQTVTHDTLLGLLFNTENIDTDNFHSTSVNSSAVTITVAGTYLIGGRIEYKGNSSGIRTAIIQSGATREADVNVPAAAAQINCVQVQVLLTFATTGATLTLQAYQNSGANLGVAAASAARNVRFWGHRLF